MEIKTQNQEKISDEIIAVISAAIAAMAENSGNGIKLRVSNIKRLPQSSPAWNLAGRAERLAQKL
ncbi:MAG: sodium pump decarboxylase subunit gamma [Clostridiales bacterium]|nr:sodium pump decarboxylase subunit gamma [Clostridiales bacterium]